VTLAAFQALLARLQHDIPAEFASGVAAVDVSPKTVPHPVHRGVYTLGECIPLNWTGDGSDLQSRIVLFYGSFLALARGNPSFDWRGEAWETLTHELRHHLEFRAHQGKLEEYDWAADQNFARHEGKPFDPAFYRSGEAIARGVFKVNDDVFLEGESTFSWHGRKYRTAIGEVTRPAFLTIHGLTEAPPGEVILVLKKRFSLRDVWRRAKITQKEIDVTPAND